MITSQNEVFNDFLISPVITSMAQEKTLMVSNGEDHKTMAILVHLYQRSTPPFYTQDTSTPAYSCRLSGIL